ncbi:Receptor-like serine/threonine-protein kinase SD1-8 [Vitis vinifera]|uniref:Receptor-like serine/threonine-protein kinase SD1-8 n=1 Tax=Vitis vinifera TaxID=29760 RepID=A0A438DP60_VITVI|nr:Receptor-like serine/threonine-protein kinase SD1-8 [Vitis vinifera]
MKGFRPKFQSNWDMEDWSNGCVRSTPLDCQKGDGFVKYSGVKLPDTRSSWFNESMNLKECASLCLSNCSCHCLCKFRYQRGGSGCLLWFGDLIDIRDFTENGQEFYVRMAAADLDFNSSKNAINTNTPTDLCPQIYGNCSSLNSCFMVKLLPSINSSSKKEKTGHYHLYINYRNSSFKSSPDLVCAQEKQETTKEKSIHRTQFKGGENNEGQEHLELPLFDLDTLLNATNNFSSDNKLGEGGFGPVYKYGHTCPLARRQVTS